MEQDRDHAVWTRAQLPRWLWGVSLGIGAVCAAMFVVALVVGGEVTPGDEVARDRIARDRIEAQGRGGLGFSAGLVVGGGVGVVIGMAIARQRRGRRGETDAAAHSSRSRP